MSEELRTALTIGGMLLAMVVILFAAYYTTRLLGKQYSGQAAGKDGQLKVVDRLMLSKSQSLCVVSAAGKTLLISVTPNAISLICELEDYVLRDSGAPDKLGPTLFYQNLVSELKKRSGRKSGDVRSESGNDQEQSEDK